MWKTSSKAPLDIHRSIEKRQICADLEASSAEVDAAMKRDFERLPPYGQDVMLDMLQKADPDNFDWWFEVLVGKTPNDLADMEELA